MKTIKMKPLRVGFLGTNGGISFAAKGFDNALSDIGLNTGNALFQYAMWSDIENPKTSIYPWMKAEYVRELVDIVVIPAANQVNPKWNLESWANFIENLDLPVVVIGLGAQADDKKSVALPLQQGTLRFLKLVSERTHSIGVRGQFTAEVLNHHGIKNAVITGCPSNFINMKYQNGRNILQQLENLKKNFTGRSAYVVGTLEERTRTAEAKLFNIAMAEKATIIYQTNPQILKYLHFKKNPPLKYFDWERKILSPQMRLENYINYIKLNGTFFSDARSWIDYCSSLDIVYGMRAHGAIAAIQGGSVGVCVVFDSRTQELFETMAYPSVTTAELENCHHLGELVKKVKFDMNKFDKKRISLFGNYESVMNKAGIYIEQKISTYQTEKVG